MSRQEIDIEKTAAMPTMTEVSSPLMLDDKRASVLSQYQILFGDVDAPPSPTAACFYQEIVTEERKARHYYYISGFFFFFFVALQIILCLSIAIGAQLGLTLNQISIMAGVNTAVAATIATLKGLGLPEKKAIERNKLHEIVERIKLTTKKLKAGLDVDVKAEIDEVRQLHDTAEDNAQITFTDVGVAAKAGATALKK